MMNALTITRAHLHDLLTDAHVALVEHRTEQAGAIIGALRKITAPDASPLPVPVPLPARPFGGAVSSVWTPERKQMLRERFPTCTDDDALVEALNALPGPPVNGKKALSAHAYTMGLKRDPEIIRSLRAKGGVVTQAARRDSGETQRPIWTDERRALLAALWPTCTDRAALMARINALPGEPVESEQAMRVTAVSLGIRTTPETERALRIKAGRLGAAVSQAMARAEPEPAPEPEAPPEPVELPPEEQARIADAAMLTKQDRAKAMLRTALAKKPKDEFAVACGVSAQTGLPTREVMRLLGEVRREGMEDAA